MISRDKVRASAGRDGADPAAPSAIHLAVHQCVTDYQDGLEALRRCARVAKADGVKPEHVVLLIHSAFDDCRGNRDTTAERDRKRFHLSSVALDAYFADGQPSP